MKTLCVVLAVTTLSVGQLARGPVAGSWVAEFQGRTFVRLELKTVDGALAGGISLGDFEVDAQGLVKRADPAPTQLMPICDVTLTGSTVKFSAGKGDSTDQFEFRLLDNSGADLQLLLNGEDQRELADSGVPLPKPIRITRAG